MHIAHPEMGVLDENVLLTWNLGIGSYEMLGLFSCLQCMNCAWSWLKLVDEDQHNCASHVSVLVLGTQIIDSFINR